MSSVKLRVAAAKPGRGQLHRIQGSGFQNLLLLWQKRSSWENLRAERDVELCMKLRKLNLSESRV